MGYRIRKYYEEELKKLREVNLRLEHENEALSGVIKQKDEEIETLKLKLKSLEEEQSQDGKMIGRLLRENCWLKSKSVKEKNDNTSGENSLPNILTVSNNPSSPSNAIVPVVAVRTDVTPSVHANSSIGKKHQEIKEDAEVVSVVATEGDDLLGEREEQMVMSRSKKKRIAKRSRGRGRRVGNG